MGRKKKPGALSAETREFVLTALAQKAAAGNVGAAKIYLDEYRQQNGAGDKENQLLLSLLDLERQRGNPD